MNEDLEQLRQFAATGSQDAFAAVVNVYLRLVYGAALRRAYGDVHQAQDVTQMVFTALARNASALSKHPDLPGWLFTTARFLAAKALRGEHRRALREHAVAEVSAMNPHGHDETSAHLHSVLDEVITELRQLDREMILLRFHGGLQMSEIGARFGITENAVQKRITRALDALKDKLARRGITSTAAAVALACEQQSAVAVPAGLAVAAISTGVAGGALGVGGLSAVVALSKTQLGFAAALVLAGSAGLVWTLHDNARLSAALAEHASAAKIQPEELRKQLAALSERAAAAEADVTKLQDALRSAKTAQAVPRPRVLTDTRAQAKAALTRASNLTREGKFQEALEEYLRTYRELAGKPGPATIDRQLIMSAIKRLADRYPPALPALRGLRDEALQRHSSNRDDSETISEIALLNDRLDDGRASMALYDTLPSGHPGRQALGTIAQNSFVEARRYTDAVTGKSFGSMMNEFEMALRSAVGQSGPGRDSHRSFVVKSTVTNIEALTGAGKHEEARILSEKLLAFDGAEETRAAIRQHVERASRPPGP